MKICLNVSLLKLQWWSFDELSFKKLHLMSSLLEKEMATQSSILAWRIPGMGEPGRLPSMGSHRVGHDCSDLAVSDLIEVKWSEMKSLSRVRLFATPWTLAYQAPPSLGFSRQEYWSGLPCPPPGDLPNPGIEPIASTAPALQMDSLPPSHRGSPISLRVGFFN